jgi:hypothetical protein
MKWLSSEGEEPEYSSCKYEVLVMDWIGRTQLIKARGVNYTGYSEVKGVLVEASMAFPEMTKKALKAHQ